MNFRTIAIITLAAPLSISLAGCGDVDAKVAQDASSETQASVIALPVEVAAASKGDIFATYHTTTAISADAEAPVLAKVEGEIIQLLAEEGDRVVAGQVLARLDGERLRLQMLQAKSALDQVRNEHKRFVSLQKRGLVSTSAVEGLSFDMDALDASYKLKRLNYSYSKIRAPISGVVSARDVKVGQHIAVGDSTFKITDTSRLVAYLKIPQSELTKFAAGHSAEIHVDAMPGITFAATIARISPTVDARNGTFRATAYIDNKAGLLAPGMFARFDIAYEKHVDALLIPAAAIVREDRLTVVYVVTDGAAERRTIVTGIESNGRVEVLDGLAANEQIIVTGQGSLRDGSKVLASIRTGTSVTG
jgi:membrane fusion protein (multidrug efflux system)